MPRVHCQRPGRSICTGHCRNAGPFFSLLFGSANSAAAGIMFCPSSQHSFATQRAQCRRTLFLCTQRKHSSLFSDGRMTVAPSLRWVPTRTSIESVRPSVESGTRSADAMPVTQESPSRLQPETAGLLYVEAPVHCQLNKPSDEKIWGPYLNIRLPER